MSQNFYVEHLETFIILIKRYWKYILILTREKIILRTWSIKNILYFVLFHLEYSHTSSNIAITLYCMVIFPSARIFLLYGI